MNGDEEKVNNEKSASDIETREFLLNVLADLIVTKNNIYNGRVFAAHSNVQKLSDKIKDKIGRL